MLKLLIILIICFINFNLYAQEFKYIFEIEHNYVDVTFIMNAKDNTETILNLPTIFTLDPKQKKIKIVINGKRIKSDLNSDTIKLNHQPFSEIYVSYKLHNMKDYYSNLPFNITNKNFFMLSKYCLLIPNVFGNELNDISFSFDSYKNAVFSNIDNINGNDFWLSNVNIEAMNDIFFIGGDNVIREKLQHRNSEIIFVGDINIDKLQITEYLSQVKEIHAKFFCENISNNDYNIFLTEYRYKDNIDAERKGNYQVVSLGFKPQFNQILRKIIAHENLHQWFNSKSFTQEKNSTENNIWFIEGFDDYYAEYLNYINELLSLEDYVKSYNECLMNYYTSPFKEAMNYEISQDPYNFQIFNINYLKDRIFAHELNYEIGRLTKNQYNLDKYIKYLMYLSSRKKDFQLSAPVLIKTLNDFTGMDFSRFINQNITKNELLVNANQILHNKANLTSTKVLTRIYNFDLSKSMYNGEITELKEDSIEYRKGMRNGQKFLGITTSNNLNDPIIVEIQNGKKKKNIKFIPLIQEITIPQYSL